MLGSIKFEFVLADSELSRIRAQIVDVLSPLFLKVNVMSQQVEALVAEVESLKTAVQVQSQTIATLVSSSDAATATMDVLKQKLDAAIAGQGTLSQVDVDALSSAITSLGEAKALIASQTLSLSKESQDLSDATATDSPSN